MARTKFKEVTVEAVTVDAEEVVSPEVEPIVEPTEEVAVEQKANEPLFKIIHS